MNLLPLRLHLTCLRVNTWVPSTPLHITMVSTGTALTVAKVSSAEALNDVAEILVVPRRSGCFGRNPGHWRIMVFPKKAYIPRLSSRRFAD
jgi:hypothetical protein